MVTRNMLVTVNAHVRIAGRRIGWILILYEDLHCIIVVLFVLGFSMYIELQHLRSYPANLLLSPVASHNQTFHIFLCKPFSAIPPASTFAIYVYPVTRYHKPRCAFPIRAAARANLLGKFHWIPTTFQTSLT
jgi:hypothetical protein